MGIREEQAREAVESFRAEMKEDIASEYRGMHDALAAKASEAIRELNEQAAQMLQGKDIQEAMKQMEAIQPYLHMISEAYPKDEPLWKYPLHIVTYPIQAHIESKGLQDASAAAIETQRGPFMEFFKAYISECRAAEKANPKALYGTAVYRQIMAALIKKGIAPEGAAQQQKSIEALTALTIKGYSFLKQGPITNRFAGANTKAGDFEIDPITGAATARNGSLVISIEHFNELTKGLETSTHQLLDILIREFTHSGGQNPLIKVPLSEYMERRGLSNQKEARKQVNADLETLRNTKIAFTDKRGSIDAYLFGGIMGIRNSVIYFSLSMPFYAILKGYPTMPISDALFKVDSRYYRHAYNLGRAIMEHKRMNIGKANENRISVNTLLGACPLLPKYKDLDKSKGEISRKIIEPFEQSLNHLEDMGIFEWAYCHSGGEPMTAEEEEQITAKSMPYALFSELLIEFSLKDYPDQNREKFLLAKAKRTKQSEKAKRERRIKRKPEAIGL